MDRDEAQCQDLTQDVLRYEDDTLEDLQRGGFRLLQKKHGFRFGMDSVLLAAYAASFCQAGDGVSIRVADLGAGCGAVSILLAARLPKLQLTGFEIDPVSVETFQRNIILNKLDKRLRAVQIDIRQLRTDCRSIPDVVPASFDLVVSNPPFGQFQPERRAQGPVDEVRRQAREETTLSLDELAGAAARLLRPGGRLVLVHQVRRLADVIASLRKVDLETKTLRLIQSLPDRQPLTFLLSAVRHGRPGGLIAQPPLLVYHSPGVFSPELASIYGLEPPMDAEALNRGIVADNHPRQKEVTG